MPDFDTLIRNVSVLDGSGREPYQADVAIDAGLIRAVGELSQFSARQVIEGNGRALSPGFIDVHTHDDTSVIRNPQMLAKLSQGVTTVIVGNCGISAAPVKLAGDPPDPMNLLGDADAFRYPTFAEYVAAVNAAKPAVNVAALAGHTALRNNHMDRLDRAATATEIQAMREQLIEALDAGALGLSTGLAYLSANSAPPQEVLSLAEPLAAAGAVYASHMRTEAEAIVEAMREAFQVGRQCQVPVVISHLKCAGVANWGRSAEVLKTLDAARADQPVQCDCYPYAASSSTLDIRQVDERVRIVITWSKPHPEIAGQTLEEIASRLGSSTAPSGGALATRRSHLPLHVRRGCAPHFATSGNHDRVGWITTRPAAPSPPVGDISPRAGLLLPGTGPLPAGRCRAQNDWHARPALRAGWPGKHPRSGARRPGALRPGDDQRYGHFQRPDPLCRGDRRGMGERRFVVSGRGYHRAARRPLCAPPAQETMNPANPDPFHP